MTGKEFVARLVEEMDQLFARLGETETLEAESEGHVDVVTLLRLALKSELEASELAGFWLPTTPEVDAKMALALQCGDEMKHYGMISQRLAELGADLTDFDPLAEGHSPLYQYLRGLRTTIERIAAGPFASEAIAKVRNAQFVKLLPLGGRPRDGAALRRDDPARGDPPLPPRPGVSWRSTPPRPSSRSSPPPPCATRWRSPTS